MITLIKYFLLLLVACFSFQQMVYSQPQGLVDIKKSVDIPFEYINNFIILNVIINEKLPLKFIFDTGAEYTILTKSEHTADLDIQFQREFKILGADLSTEIIAYLGRNVSFQISKLYVPSADILVFKDDYFQFEELIGIKVDGIIGANIFSQFILGINYKKRIITLHNPSNFSPPNDKYVKVPISVIKNKPYLTVKTKINSVDQEITLKLLLDTGASLSLLLYTDTNKNITFPPTLIKGSIGIGLGGNLEGFLGRVHELAISDFKLHNVITNFQEIHEFLDTSFLSGKNGIIGNLVLDRFNLIIDYNNELIYLKPSKKFKKVFEYDKSGLMLIATGKDLRTILVNNVVSGSPADEAGIKNGDVIRRINWLPSGYSSMKDLIRIFQKKEGKKIKLTIRRDGVRMKFEFRLRNLI